MIFHFNDNNNNTDRPLNPCSSLMGDRVSEVFVYDGYLSLKRRMPQLNVNVRRCSALIHDDLPKHF